MAELKNSMLFPQTTDDYVFNQQGHKITQTQHFQSNNWMPLMHKQLCHKTYNTPMKFAFDLLTLHPTALSYLLPSQTETLRICYNYILYTPDQSLRCCHTSRLSAHCMVPKSIGKKVLHNIVHVYWVNTQH